VDQRDALALVGDRVVERGADQPLAAFDRNRLDSDARALRETDFLDAHLIPEEIDDFLHFRRSGVPFDSGVDVLGVLAEDDHIGLLGGFHRRGDAVEVAHRAQADVKIELLAQRDVERADAAADRGGQRSFDGDQVFADGVDGLAGQPQFFAVDPVGLFARVEFHPGDGAFVAVGFFDGAVPDPHGGGGDIRPDAVAFDEADDRPVRNLKFPGSVGGDAFARRNFDLIICHYDVS